MADNFNINTSQDQSLISGGLDVNNPSMTYVDFANQIVRNAQEQKRQEELVQQAMEATKQSKLSTKQKTQADELGVNPELRDVFTVPEAVAYLKAAGVDDVQIQSFVESIGDQRTVSKAAVDTIIRKKERMAKAGVPFIASEEDAKNPSMLTKEGDQLVAGQSYYDTGEVDSDGNAVYAHGGKEPVDQEAKIHMKEEEAKEKQWQKLDTELNKFIRSSRGNALTQAAQRDVRGLNELAEGQPITKQMLHYIQKDVSGIFQGGVPPVTGADAEDFTNVKQQLNAFINKYTGMTSFFRSDIGDQREYLLGLLMRLRESTIGMLEAALKSSMAGYEQIINDQPDRWERMLKGKMGAVSAGLSKNAETTMKAMKETKQGNLPPAMTPKGEGAAAAPAEGQPDIHALAAALGLKKKAQ